MAYMFKIHCALCSQNEDCSIMYVTEDRKLAVHQDCLLYSSGFTDSEDYTPENPDIRFKVASVRKEVKRGKRLVCNFCQKKGATVGCEVKNCRRSYHYFCALCDDAAIDTKEEQGIYRVYCRKHDPERRTKLNETEEKIQELLEKRKRLDNEMATVNAQIQVLEDVKATLPASKKSIPK